MKEQKRSSKTIDIVIYALKVSVNGVMCVCSVCVDIHLSTKTCVTGNKLGDRLPRYSAQDRETKRKGNRFV